MYIPTQKQFQKVISTLEKANKIAKFDSPVDMSLSKVCGIKDVCGTPMCHGGWYAFVKHINIHHKYIFHEYEDGAFHMAIDLGFDDKDCLKSWAREYSYIWGNQYGYKMFHDGLAFGQDSDNGFTLQIIIDHWKGVKERSKNYKD